MNADEGCAGAGPPDSPSAGVPSRRRAEWVVAGAIAAAAGAAVLLATRQGPLLSPDSVTYLATAEHLRSGGGFTDFTGEPMTVFGPVYPLLLAPGGTSLGWVRTVGAAGTAAVALTFFALARRRTTAVIALVATAVVALAASTVWVGSTAWSETTYTAIGLGMLVVLTGGRPTPRRVAAAGVLAGLGFLTRYAGAGLVLTGAIALLVGRTEGSTWRTRARSVVVFGVAAAATVVPWVARNLAATGEALGPRFSGGAADDLPTLLHRPITALGRVVTGEHRDGALVSSVGWITVVAIVFAVAWLAWRLVRRRDIRTLDAAAVALATTCVIVPLVARALTANDIEQRVMSPTLSALALLGVIAVDAARAARARGVRLVVPALAVALALVSVVRGADEVDDLPRLLWGSSANREVYSPQLHDAIDALPPGIHLLTNNPQRVWWQHRREPTLFAFTRPRAGNSHYPLPAADVLDLACDGDTYLAWFVGLANAGEGPEERRPDLLRVVRLDPVREVAGGTLYEVLPLDPTACPARST